VSGSGSMGSVSITRQVQGDSAQSATNHTHTPCQGSARKAARASKEGKGDTTRLQRTETHAIKHGTSGARHTRRGAGGTLGDRCGKPTPTTRRRGRGQTGAVREETGDRWGRLAHMPTINHGPRTAHSNHTPGSRRAHTRGDDGGGTAHETHTHMAEESEGGAPPPPPAADASRPPSPPGATSPEEGRRERQ
jgi:hypothetical protein